MAGSITWSPTVIKAEKGNALHLISTAGGSFPVISMNMWHLTIRHFLLSSHQQTEMKKERQGWRHWDGGRFREERDSVSLRHNAKIKSGLIIRTELFIVLFHLVWSYFLLSCFRLWQLCLVSAKCRLRSFSKSDHIEQFLHYVSAVLKGTLDAIVSDMLFQSLRQLDVNSYQANSLCMLPDSVLDFFSVKPMSPGSCVCVICRNVSLDWCNNCVNVRCSSLAMCAPMSRRIASGFGAHLARWPIAMSCDARWLVL